ncbi:5415_t:CDS:2 [Acaulospora morrowiae]|uniref:Glycine cleavage system H protein n=1 Tax=Acaulospora morrowiae TaxID=94023 RepID=A0A9N9HXW0_9GLOM|nr:5415_t:CDS:2 [Acaulospora morrowiae]
MPSPVTLRTISSKAALYVPNFKSIITRSGITSSLRAYSSKLYTKEHEWIDVKHSVGTVGITDYAQSSLGDVVFVDLPKVGDVVEQFGHCGCLESVKAASDLYAPVSGKVIEANTKLTSEPGLINKSPEEEGWLCKIELSNSSELKSLLDKKAYDSFCKESKGSH